MGPPRGWVEPPLSEVTVSLAADQAGAETLEIMQAAPRYNRWQYDQVAPFLGHRVCEVGSGIGNMSSMIAATAPDLLVLTDTDPYYNEALRNRFTGCSNVLVEKLTLPDRSAKDRFQHFGLDTVVALNVIEHIEDDLGALKSIAAMLQPRGRAVVLVPALPVLFGSLDRELGHYRRYTRTTLGRVMREAGFIVEHAFYFNLFGSLGWWVNARLWKSPRIPVSQLRSFDRLVPLLRLENHISLPFGQSLIAVGTING